MKIHDGHIRYNSDQNCYGMMDEDGNWIKEKLENGDRIDVVINGERFATNFEETPYYKALKPQVWSNWKFIAELPAAYYEFETDPKGKPLRKKEERRLRLRFAFLLIGISLAVSVLLGALFALIGLNEDTTYLENFAIMTGAMFWFVGAGVAAGGILLLANIVSIDLCIGFGCALYYGTILLSGFLSNFIYSAESDRYIISFVIVSLVCYIVWLRKFKPETPK